MRGKAKVISFWISLLLFVVVVPYSIAEWFETSIPFNNNLYILSAFSTLLLLINIYYLLRKDD